jgi:hypothetical protein
MVSGIEGSIIVWTTSTNGTPAIAAQATSGLRFKTAPINKPPALLPNKIPHVTTRAKRKDKVLKARPTFHRQKRMLRHILLDQKLSRRHKILKRMLLLLELASLIPTPPILTAASHMGNTVNNPSINVTEQPRTKRRVDGDTVRAVAVQHARVCAVGFEERFLVDNRDGNRGRDGRVAWRF